MSGDPKVQAEEKSGFDLDASEEEILEEFGLLMAAEYAYSPKANVVAVLQPRDKVSALIRYTLPGVALRIPRRRLEARFETALKNSDKLLKG